MGETSPPTAADWANATASDAHVKARANAGALDLLLNTLESKGILSHAEVQEIHLRTLRR